MIAWWTPLYGVGCVILGVAAARVRRSEGAAGSSPESKTRDAEIERRLNACEINLQNIWEHLNGNAGNG